MGPGPAGALGGTAGTGTGLRNVRDRLAGLYGAGQLLRTLAGPGGGTEVRLELPVIMERAPVA